MNFMKRTPLCKTWHNNHHFLCTKGRKYTLLRDPKPSKNTKRCPAMLLFRRLNFLNTEKSECRRCKSSASCCSKEGRQKMQRNMTKKFQAVNMGVKTFPQHGGTKSAVAFSFFNFFFCLSSGSCHFKEERLMLRYKTRNTPGTGNWKHSLNTREQSVLVILKSTASSIAGEARRGGGQVRVLAGLEHKGTSGQ